MILNKPSHTELLVDKDFVFVNRTVIISKYTYMLIIWLSKTFFTWLKLILENLFEFRKVNSGILQILIIASRTLDLHIWYLWLRQNFLIFIKMRHFYINILLLDVSRRNYFPKNKLFLYFRGCGYELGYYNHLSSTNTRTRILKLLASSKTNECDLSSFLLSFLFLFGS